VKFIALALGMLAVLVIASVDVRAQQGDPSPTTDDRDWVRDAFRPKM